MSKKGKQGKKMRKDPVREFEKIKNNKLKKDHTEIRKFGYSQGTVDLNFSLRVDIKQSLKDFKDLLVAALSDVNDELEKK